MQKILTDYGVAEVSDETLAALGNLSSKVWEDIANMPANRLKGLMWQARRATIDAGYAELREERRKANLRALGSMQV